VCLQPAQGPVKLTNKALQDVSRVHINGAEGDELLAVQLAEVAIDQLNQATQLIDLHNT
jgi:hypothetical protein